MKTSKRLWILVVLLGATSLARAATNDLTSLLQQGLFEEEANRNLDAAIASYQSLATQFDKDRQVAATAVFRLGECYRKLGKTNEAVVQYQRILRDFSDQQTLATLSRQNLTGLGVAQPQTAGAQSREATASLREALKETEQNLAELMVQTNSGWLIALNSTNAEQSRLLVQLDNLQKELAQRMTLYPPSSGMITTLQKSIDDLKKQIGEPRAAGGESVVDQIQTLRQRIARLRLQLTENLVETTEASVSGSGSSSSMPVTDEEEKEIRRIQAMIQNSPDRINAPGGGPNGSDTPLMSAVRAGYLRVAAFLLDHGAEVNLKSSGDTPLHAAVRSGNKTMTEFLLDRGADVNACDATGGTPLHIAAEAGFRAVAEVLLNHKADVNAHNSRQNGERTPLHRAASSGNVEMIKLLIDHGADVNAKTTSGTTPLVDALSAGTLKPLIALLEVKADPNIADNIGQTPLSHAVGAGNLEAVKALLAAKADPNKAREDGRTPLSFAAEGGLLDIANALLDAKADPNAGSLDLPLAVAIEATYGSGFRLPGTGRFPKLAMCDLLLRYGADPNKSAALQAKASLPKMNGDYPQGSTPNVSPIQLAVARRETEVVKLLLGHKADANASSVRDVPLLFEAVTAENQEIAEALLAHGADVNARSWGKLTPLHYAVSTGKAGLVKLLLDHKADVNVRDASGRTALDNAKVAATRPTSERKQWEEIAVLLRAHGALDNLPNWDSIALTRPSANFSTTAFSKGTNDWNRFTLLEALAENYGLVNTRLSGDASSYSVPLWPEDALRFPNFRAVVIHRPSTDGKSWKDIPVNVADILSSGDCSRNVWLEWGDIIELPEVDHPVAENWGGLSGSELLNLSKCVSRTVTISINQKSGPFTNHPVVVVQGIGSRPIVAPTRKSMSFMVRSVLDQSKLIRFSSDLSHVKVTQRDAGSGKTQSWVLDCSNPNNAPDFWLRDGDVVEVPEK